MPEEIKAYASMEPLAKAFVNEVMKHYWIPLYRYFVENPELPRTLPDFLLGGNEILVYIGRTHIGLEYLGAESPQDLKLREELEIRYYDYSISPCNLLEKIIGFNYDTTPNPSIVLPDFIDDFILPTNRGFDKLAELKWNFAAQSFFMGLNSPVPGLVPGRFHRIVNGLFFDSNESGLKARRIKWLDLIPVRFDDSDTETDLIAFNLKWMKKLVEYDAQYVYPLPDDYKYIQLPKINRFIEIWGDSTKSETDITRFLSQSQNEFILTMKFGAKNVFSELRCEWNSENREAIKPDFFIVQPNGYADIVEFKLPNIDKSPVVGNKNRETFSAWLNSYISQTRVYATYFEDPNNRRWFENKYGFRVHKPRRWLVVGRRSDFDSDIWREIMFDYKDIEIITFDDLVDGVVVQFYK